MNLLQNFELAVSSLTNNFCVCLLTTELAEIMQTNGHYALQGHSRSPIFIPIENSYGTSYLAPFPRYSLR